MRTVRRTTVLSKRLMDDVISVAPPELKGNWNRLVTLALESYARERRRMEFEQSMARMAADPAIRSECAAIQRDFADKEALLL